MKLIPHVAIIHALMSTHCMIDNIKLTHNLLYNMHIPDKGSKYILKYVNWLVDNDINYFMTKLPTAHTHGILHSHCKSGQYNY